MTGASCVTCGESLRGPFCWNCGERKLGEHDYSLHHFLKHALEAFTHLDGNIVRSARLLVTRPGFLTGEYLVGRRTSYAAPLQLFLIMNLAYFLIQPWIGWNSLTTSLAAHLNDEFYSPIARRLVDHALHRMELPLSAFEQRFDTIAATHAKSLVILMVPIFASALTLVHRGANRYYVEHLFFSLHFFAFWLILTSANLVVTNIVVDTLSAKEIPVPWELIVNVSSSLQFVLVAAYLYFACGRVYGGSKKETLLKSLGLGIAVFGVLQIYRFILFFTTLYSL
jgi:uncharacterized protein DUF3667